ncbi:MAG: O-phosphoserine--tRNA ligase [Candidatus Altiarchaeales archaeon]|nr:MAG: O-phosphoserine--tRNA ligase [Candidatus Altiarchaeales archaeon]
MNVRGKSHPVQDLIQEIRNVFLDLGFDEIENQIFIPESDVYKQYGQEAAVVLDRCYYLAGLPRPDIGLSEEKIKLIRKINSRIDIGELKRIFREYKEGSIEGDDLAEEMVNRLNIEMNDAMKIIDLFPEFKSLEPIPTRTTLRSHMTAAWFMTLEAMQDIYELPLKLFSIGLRFRREQRVDRTHLRAHYGASSVVMDENLNIEDGKRLSEKILKRIGFKEIEFVKKRATSNYYERGLEFEVFSDGVEIADCGIYSKRALKNYGIRYPVFNIGFGLERILMLRMKKDDIREIMYPQFYTTMELSDEEIAKSIYIDRIPETEDGKKLSKLITRVARKNSDEESPCRFLVYEGGFLGKRISVYLLEKESNTRLLGPAALNDIYVYNGNIYGIPPEPEKLDRELINVKRNGVRVNFSYIDAISNLFASEIEDLVRRGEKWGFIQVKMAKSPSDINISIGRIARRFITSRNKEIMLRGPIFTSIEVFIAT